MYRGYADMPKIYVGTTPAPKISRNLLQNLTHEIYRPPFDSCCLVSPRDSAHNVANLEGGLAQTE